MIKEVEDFINQFIKSEYEFWQLFYSERDYDNLKPIIDKINEYFKPRSLAASEGFGRIPKNPPENWFILNSKSLNDISERTLFQIKEYVHNEYGYIYRCYVSNTQSFAQGHYSALFFVTQIDGNYKIISIYIKKHDANIEDTTLNGWRYGIGVKINLNKPPTNILKVTPPLKEQYVYEYEME